MSTLMNVESKVPPGFRFHPTDEELVDYYLRKKASACSIDLDIIREVDLYKIEPWDLPERCQIGLSEENGWYFFSQKDKKYPSGTRTNRSTAAGFWKATGRDKAIYSNHKLVGMRKTLVFYKGRAPNGQKSNWIMHEYRLETGLYSEEESWVVCKLFLKKCPSFARHLEYDLSSSALRNQMLYSSFHSFNHHPQKGMLYNDDDGVGGGDDNDDDFSDAASIQCKKEAGFDILIPRNSFKQMPSLESPSDTRRERDEWIAFAMREKSEVKPQAMTDWRVFDQLVASQLSHESSPKFTVTHNNQPPTTEMASVGKECFPLER